MWSLAKLLPLSALLLLTLGCASTDRRLEDLRWGAEMDGEYDLIIERTRFVLRKMYPKGLDPDRSREDDGEFSTVWHYKRSEFYRGTTRNRARVVVEASAPGRVRVGVAVVQQLSDNIDNPSSIEEARWIKTQNDPGEEKLILDRVAQRYLDIKPSEWFEEKHRVERRGTVREDLVDRTKDVNLEGTGGIDPNREAPTVTGEDAYRKKRENSGDGK